MAFLAFIFQSHNQGIDGSFEPRQIATLQHEAATNSRSVNTAPSNALQSNYSRIWISGHCSCFDGNTKLFERKPEIAGKKLPPAPSPRTSHDCAHSTTWGSPPKHSCPPHSGYEANTSGCQVINSATAPE